jgi:hypothetical protein
MDYKSARVSIHAQSWSAASEKVAIIAWERGFEGAVVVLVVEGDGPREERSRRRKLLADTHYHGGARVDLTSGYY